MNKNYQYYNNRNVYGDICVPKREEILGYLIKNKYLSEFQTNEEKQRVLQNLGILQEINNLLNLIDQKADISELANYITLQYFLEKTEELKPKDEKAKGFYSSIESLLEEYPTAEPGDWAIVNVENAWYIYRYNEDWEYSGVNLDDYLTKSELASLDFADKQFVRDSISIAAATFRGTYNSLEELQQQEADNNDYGFVQTIESENIVYNRYKFNGEEWIFEYKVNTSSFTPEQWEAINSGITNIDKLKLDNLPTKQQLDSSLAEKVNINNVYTKQEVYNKQEVYTKQEVNNAIKNIKPEINHIFLTQAQYDALQTYEKNTLYLIVDSIEPEEIGTRFGDRLPIRFSSTQIGTKFGDRLPIRFISWVFENEFPITFS